MTLLLAAALAPGLLASGKPKAVGERKVPGQQTGERAEAAGGPKPLGIPMTMEAIRTLMGQAIRSDPDAYGVEQRLAFGTYGRDLRGRDLRGLDLRDLDLRRYRLEGADLTGTRLDRSNLTGVPLTNARLFGATTFFTRGLDLEGAQVHPFFMDVARDGFGTLRWLDLAETDGTLDDPPGCLASTPDHPLVYLSGDGRRQRVLAVTGVTYDLTLESKARTLALATDAKGRLVSLADDGWLRLISVKERGAGHRGLDTRAAALPVPLDQAGDLISLRAQPTVAVDLAFGNVLLRLQSSAKAQWKTLKPPGGLAIAHGVHTRSGAERILAIKGTNKLLHQIGNVYFSHLLPEGTRCAGMTLAPDGRVWFTYTGKGGHGIGQVDPTTRQMALAAAPQPAEGARAPEPGALVALPDGRGVWYCDGGGRIVCVAGEVPDTVFIPFELPEGDRPVSLTPSFDGRLFFRLEGRTRIGSIQPVVLEVVRKPAAGVAGTEAGEAEAETEAKHPRLTGSQRRERAYQREARGREKTGAATEMTAEGAGMAPLQAEGASGAPDQVEGAAAASARAGRSGAGAGAAQASAPSGQVLLAPAVLRRIRAKHGYDQRPDKSQFREAFSSAQALEDLIVQGLDEAGGAVGRIRSTTVQGSYKTLCRRTGVGFCHDGDGWVATDLFVVVTVQTMDRTGHEVVTAYPVPSRGI